MNESLFVVKGRPAIAEAQETILGISADKTDAERHIDALETQGFYAYIQEYIPAESKFFCSEHTTQGDHPLGCIVCSKPAQYARYAIHGKDNGQRN